MIKACVKIFSAHLLQFADENDLKYYETSAKYPDHLDQVVFIILGIFAAVCKVLRVLFE